MIKKLKTSIINLKYLNQDIDDPIIVNAADANGCSLRIIFTQEAAAHFSDSTKVYLSWWHRDKNIRGYNVFTEIKKPDDKNFPPTWELFYPQSMLHDGNVIACIELVDKVSIAASSNFVINVLLNPDDGTEYIASNDYSEFKNAVITLNSLADEMENQIAEDQEIFAGMLEEFEEMKETVASTEELEEVRLMAQTALDNLENQQEQIDDTVNSLDELESQHIRDLTFYEFF